MVSYAPSGISSSKMLARVLFSIRDAGRGGMTDEEMQLELSMPGNSQRPRRVVLVQMGLVCDGGIRRRTLSGRSAIAWVDVALEDLTEQEAR